MKGVLSIALALLVVAALAACGGSRHPKAVSNYYAPGPTTQTSTAPATTYPAPKMNAHGTRDVSGMSSVNVELDNYYFAPTIIKATPGQKLTIHLSNHGTVEHNFSVPGEGIDRDVPAKKTATVQVTVPTTGTRVFYCRYHKKLGMAGELTGRQPAFTG